ncbi:MAG: putative Zn-dependent protease, partial [Cognaticolwellia sp.]
ALRLDLYGDYGLGLEPSHINIFLQEYGDEAQVVVAAAQALERSGDPAGALAILEDAAEQSPNDMLIQRALAKRKP